MSSKVKTRILIISDTHASIPKSESSTNYAFRDPLPQADVAIHCGDLTMNGTLDQHEAAITLLKSINAKVKVVIPGNHDLTLDTTYYEKYGHLYGPRPPYKQDQLQQIRHLYTGPEAKELGICYLEEGFRTLQLGNDVELTLYASAYTPEFCRWSFAYELWEDRFNSPDAPNPVPTGDDEKKVDIFVTHGPPHTILDRTARDEHVGCPHLLTAISQSRPLLHCFGHIHEGWGAVRKSWPPPVIPSTTTSANPSLNPEKLDDKLKMERFHQLKEDQMRAWARNHTQTEKEIEIDMRKALKDRGAYIDATMLNQGEETLFVNASIMSLQYQPVQAPWIVDLMLERKK